MADGRVRGLFDDVVRPVSVVKPRAVILDEHARRGYDERPDVNRHLQRRRRRNEFGRRTRTGVLTLDILIFRLFSRSTVTAASIPA